MVLKRDTDDIDEDQHCNHRRDPAAFWGAPPFNGDGADPDVGDQQYDFGQDPRLRCGRAKQHGEHDGCNQQHCVDDMGCNLYELLLQQGIFRNGPVRPYNEEKNAKRGGCYVQVLDEQIVHIGKGSV